MGLKSYISLCGGTIPQACFGDTHHVFSFNFRLIWGQVKIEGKLYDRSTTPECSEDLLSAWFAYCLVFVSGMGH